MIINIYEILYILMKIRFPTNFIIRAIQRQKRESKKSAQRICYIFE